LGERDSTEGECEAVLFRGQYYYYIGKRITRKETNDETKCVKAFCPIIEYKNWVYWFYFFIDIFIEVNISYFFSDNFSMLDSILYRIIIGSLIYLIITHLDTAYVVHVVSQFVTSSIIVYWVVVLCILWFL